MISSYLEHYCKVRYRTLLGLFCVCRLSGGIRVKAIALAFSAFGRIWG